MSAPLSVIPDERLPVLAAQINQAHDLACRSAQAAINHAIAVGTALAEAKALVEHGGWLPWLAENFDFSEDTAQNYMKLARNRERVLANTERVRDLPIREALKSLRKSTGITDTPVAPLPVTASADTPRALPAPTSPPDDGDFRHRIRTVGIDPACGLGPADDDDTEALQAEIDELREINAALEAENDSLRAELKHFDEMRLQWERGGFEQVIADKNEEIRVLKTRVERESKEKRRNLNDMERWKKWALEHGWTHPNHVVIPLDDAPDVPRGAA
jgi:hypothetical protein